MKDVVVLAHNKKECYYVVRFETCKFYIVFHLQTEHNKQYDANEEHKRKEIFRENFEKVNEHNKKYKAGEVTFEMAINKFSDLTEDEIGKYTGVLPGHSGAAGVF